MARDFTRELGYLPFGSRLKRIGERLQAETARFLLQEGIDLPAGIWPLLMTLAEDGPLTVGELAAALGVSQPGVTRNLRQMEATGIVRLVRDQEDQRRKMVAISDRGADIVRRTQSELWPHVEAAVSGICSPLSGNILDQLDRIEDELDRMPLDRRAALHREGRAAND